MAQLVTAYLTREKLESILKVLKARDLKGIGITISINDDANQWGQNVSSFVSQSQEERQAKKDKFYVFNGNTVWSNNGEPVFKKDTQEKQTPKFESSDNDLPF